MLTATLNKIYLDMHRYYIFHDGIADLKDRSNWEELLKHLGKTKADDEQLPLETLLESTGLDFALFALGGVKGYDNAIRLYACRCAKQALSLFEKGYPGYISPLQAIETAERFTRGEATVAEMDAVCDTQHVGICFNISGVAYYTCEYSHGDSGPSVARSVFEIVRDTVSQINNKTVIWDAVEADFKREFIRLCRLEGEYGEVSKF